MKYTCKKCGAIVLSNPMRPSQPLPGELCAECSGRVCHAPTGGVTADGVKLDCGKAKLPDDPTCWRPQCRDWAKRRPATYPSIAQLSDRRRK